MPNKTKLQNKNKKTTQKKPAQRKQIANPGSYYNYKARPNTNSKSLVVKIINSFIYIFGGLLLCIYLIIFVIEVAQSLGKPILGYQFYQLVSGSMYPEQCAESNYAAKNPTSCLHIGDKILVQSTDNYEVGDVITYIEVDGHYVTHRIVSINDGIIVTKGDANQSEDPPIHLDNIMGKMVKKANFIKFILDIKYPLAAIFAAIILIVFFLKRK